MAEMSTALFLRENTRKSHEMPKVDHSENIDGSMRTIGHRKFSVRPMKSGKIFARTSASLQVRTHGRHPEYHIRLVRGVVVPGETFRNDAEKRMAYAGLH